MNASGPVPRSRLSRELLADQPHWKGVPEKLDRAWAWLESHPVAWAFELTASLSVSEWFDGEAPEDVLPFAVVSGDGSLAALWLDGERMRVVLLGSEGDGYVLADDAEQFVQLLAIGYGELTRDELGRPPANVDAVAAAGEFRTWVRGELGLEVPPEWPAVGDDEFTMWLDARFGKEPTIGPAPAGEAAQTEIGGDVDTLISMLGRPDGAAVTEDLGALLGRPLKATLRASSRGLRRAGMEVESDRYGIQTVWIALADYPHPDRLVAGLGSESTKADVLALLGVPEREGETWVRYIVRGRYMHLEMENGTLARVTLMTGAP